MTRDKAIYQLLANEYQRAQAVMTEIINLQAILNLPKGTEHFLSDLHGEADCFFYLLRNASGVIHTKINLVFGESVSKEEKKALAQLIYYPERELAKM